VRFNPCHRSDVWRERLSGGHPEAPLLLYVGRLAPEKRVEWLHFILDTLHEARLAIVGDGPSRAALEERFADTPTFFAGYLRGEALSCAYASADVFCFPSATETFGNVVTEAMASGLPVVAPHSGGPADLVAKVWRLASNLTYARELGANARAYAETQSWPAVLDGLLEDYALLGF
jgi:glycosyltransferase involved in cell wall biosynthesis